jgi:hypothetical protein
MIWVIKPKALYMKKIVRVKITEKKHKKIQNKNNEC